MYMNRNEPWHFLTNMNRVFDRLNLTDNDIDSASIETTRWTPAVDIVEEKNQYVLSVDLPGVKKDQFDISMEDNVLTITGERRDERKIEKEAFTRFERVKGTFYRRFSLPDTVAAEQIEANLKGGVLTIVIPKKKDTQKRISVTVSEE